MPRRLTELAQARVTRWWRVRGHESNTWLSCPASPLVIIRRQHAQTNNRDRSGHQRYAGRSDLRRWPTGRQAIAVPARSSRSATRGRHGHGASSAENVGSGSHGADWHGLVPGRELAERGRRRGDPREGSARQGPAQVSQRTRQDRPGRRAPTRCHAKHRSVAA